jgi:hypothetical protein
MQATALLRHSWRDAPLVALAAAHGVVLALLPAAPVVAVGVWWSSNTVSHNFIHKPFFRRPWMNVSFSFYLTALLGIPQTLWRDRHLAHHAGRPWRLRISGRLALETALVLVLWALLLAFAPGFFLAVYVPGYAAGLALCHLHGYYEHARGTVSHYGSLYNLLFFNDGYHVEHHNAPGIHWSDLPRNADREAPANRWPAVLRWLDALSLESLERLALRSRIVQRWLLACHERAFRKLLPEMESARRVAIVGGGLFPRTALLLRKLLPDAKLVVIDLSRESIERARPFLDESVELVHAVYDADTHRGFDLVVVPLAFLGDRSAVYERPNAPAVMIHDWIWRRRGSSALVSLLLLKRINLVTS